jgi:DNA-binding NarL/FixJ family response regulator
VTLRQWRRQRPIRVALYVADHALRADIADACEDADIAVASPLPYPPPQAGEGREGEDADVVLIDRPVETAVPAIALVSREIRKIWPANVRAVVPTDVDATTLMAIITVVAAGYTLAPYNDLAGEGTGKDISKDIGIWADPGDSADELASALTPREREVLALLAEGASNKEIARALALSVHTVKFHVASLTEKLGARSRVEAVAIAIRAGLVMV